MFEKSVSRFLIRRLLGKNKINLIDVGARDGLNENFEIFSDNLYVHFFDPDQDSIIKTDNCVVYPYALSDSDKLINFNFLESPGASSVLTPNYNLTCDYPNSSRFNIKKSIKLDAKSLDHFNIRCDALKIDVQGYEDYILNGALRTLQSTFIVQAEVEFRRIYQSQALFGDICEFLEEQKFVFIDFTNLTRWSRSNKSWCSGGDLIFGDALFIKKLEDIDQVDINTYMSLLLIYKRFDIIDFYSVDNYVAKRLVQSFGYQFLKAFWNARRFILRVVRLILSIDHKHLKIMEFY